jgi:hypothetical protein
MGVVVIRENTSCGSRFLNHCAVSAVLPAVLQTISSSGFSDMQKRD